jgi:cytochrome c oxidase subunit 2
MLDILSSVLKFLSDLFASFSPSAQTINNLFIKFLYFAAFITVLIVGLVVTEAIRFRATKHPGIPKQTAGNKNLEIAWTVIPFIIVAVFFVLSLEAMVSIDAPNAAGRKPDIVVVAHQWWWQLSYPDYHVVTANELHIPVGKRLLMHITSADVIHDWSVPELGRKVDAIPGKVNNLWIEADKAGVYDGTCNEYCGAQHAWMLIRVVAQPEDEFERWIKNEEESAAPPKDALALAGETLFQKMTCGSCHTVAGTPDTGAIGPNLTHFASRKTLLTGMLPNTEASLTRWLTDPQKLKPGALMPDFMLNRTQVSELTAYLEGLK